LISYKQRSITHICTVHKLVSKNFPCVVEDGKKPTTRNILAQLIKITFNLDNFHFRQKLLTNSFRTFFTSNLERFIWRWNSDEIKLGHSQIFAYDNSSRVPLIKNVGSSVTDWKIHCNLIRLLLWNFVRMKSIDVKNYLSHDPNFKGQRCTSIGKFSKFMGHAALIVNLKHQKVPKID
jgi:hypothetical protein